jgi:hypothetical protein
LILTALVLHVLTYSRVKEIIMDLYEKFARGVLKAHAKYGTRFQDLVQDPRGQIAAFGLN